MEALSVGLSLISVCEVGASTLRRCCHLLLLLEAAVASGGMSGSGGGGGGGVKGGSCGGKRSRLQRKKVSFIGLQEYT